MGRPGRTSGGGMRSGSSHSSVRHSSSRSHSSSSFGGGSSRPNRPNGNFSNFGPSFGPQPNHGPGPSFGPGPNFGPGHGPYYQPHPPRPPRPPRAHFYYGGSRPGGCMSSFISYTVAMIFIVVLIGMIYGMTSGGANNSFSGNQYSSNTIDEDVVFAQAQEYYGQHFNDENHVLLYYAYLEEAEADTAVMIVGDNAYTVFDDNMQDRFWNIYDEYYYGDYSEAEWLGYSFEDMAREMRNSISNNKPFNSLCYEDNLKWIKMADKDDLVDGFKAFYNATGIQAFVVLVDYSTLPGVVISTGNNSTVLKTFIIAIAVIIVVFILYKWWKKKQQRKKEEAEQTERILNTPLEKFGTSEVDDLMNKYDDN